MSSTNPKCSGKKTKLENIKFPAQNITSSVPKLSTLTTPSNTETENVTIRRAKLTRSTTPTTVQKSPENYMMDELKVYMADLINNSMESIKQAITDLTTTIRDQNTRIEQLEARVSMLENNTEQTQSCNIAALEHTIAQLKNDISQREQSLLLNDVEIAGCPEAPNENCVHLVLSIAKKVGVELDERDVVSVHRAGPARPTAAAASSERARPRPLAVRLARRALRDALLRAARVRRNLTTEGLQLPGAVNSVYINERLTKPNRILFQKCRSLARELQYKYVWTRDGKIFVCQAQGKPKYRMRTEEDLLSVFGKNVI